MGKNKWGNITPPPIGVYDDGKPHPELAEVLRDDPVEVEIKKRGRKKKNDAA
jgi:hypothetical protein